MSEITATGVSVFRDKRTILGDVSARFAGGELVALIGPNGAGKSTLLSVLAGLIRPDAGDVTLDKTPLDRLSRIALARRRAYIPQNPRCEWPITVESLVGLGLSPDMPLFGALTAAQRGRVDATLRECDLDKCRHQPATTLSGGELHRAMLARALVADPPVLIFDEPTAGLDPRHTLDAMCRFGRLAQNGHLLLVAMHDLSLVGRFATRIIALKGGRLLADGATMEQLSEALLREVFEVDAKLVRQGKDVLVSFEIDSSG
jgi:iron complex transport system ATP-binding protein